MSGVQVLVIADWSLGRDDLQVLESSFVQWQISYNLRFVAASLASGHLHKILEDFEGQGGALVIVVESMPAGVDNQVASVCDLPILMVDLLLEDQSSGSDHQSYVARGSDRYNAVAYMGRGLHALRSAATFAAKVLAANDKGLAQRLRHDRQRLKAKLIEYDASHAKISGQDELMTF